MEGADCKLPSLGSLVNLKSTTRAFYEPVMTYVLEKNGDKDMTKMQRKDVLAAMQANTHRARFANAIPSVLSVICEHAIDLGWIKENPAKGIRKIKIPKEKQRPHIVPTDADVKAFRARASERALLIFEIGVGTVQRPGDWVGFTWGDYDGSTLKLRQNKTDVPLKLPCTPLLKAALDRAKASLGAEPHPARTILTTVRGERLTYNGLLQIMRKERARLGMAKAFDQHGLRYRGVMELAWAGCDDDEIASFSGHTTKAMIIKYAGEARQIMRAIQAASKRQ